MARSDTVEVVDAISRMAGEIARAVGEGIGIGIAKALGTDRPITMEPLPGNEIDETEGPTFFPDVERDGRWINPDFQEDGNAS